MSTRKKIAVLVGVTDYQRENEKLAFCKLDVEMLKDVLLNKGFNCHAYVDDDLRPVLQKLKDVASQATKPGDVIVFYFSGHGTEVLGEQFLLGRNGSLASLKHALHEGDVLRLSEVLEELANSPALKLIVVDACRSAADVADEHLLTYGTNIVDQRRLAFQHIANCVIAFASADGQKSQGYDNRGSLFTLELAEQLRRYRSDFVHAVQRAISALRSANVTQIPWVYASTFSSVVPDRLSVKVNRVESGSLTRLAAEKFIGYSAGQTYGLSRCRLVKFSNGGWNIVSNVKNCGDLVAVAFAKDTVRLGAVRGKSAYISIEIAPPQESSSVGPLELRKLGSSRLTHPFGVAVSPSGDRVVVYGVPSGAIPGLTCWQVETDGKRKRILVDGAPLDQCNAAQWTSSSQLFASFSREDADRSSIFSFALNDKGTLVGEFITFVDSRVTVIEVVGEASIWLGDTRGAVLKLRLDTLTLTRIERSHKLDPDRCPSGKKGWKGLGDSYFEKTPAVVWLSHHHELRVLAVSFFDQTIEFVDLDSETTLASFGPEQYPRRQLVSRTPADSFLSLRGFCGEEFQFAQD